jgi:hypothetical protein
MAYIVFFQPVDPYTTPGNAALTGEVFDLEKLLDEKGGGKSYCDGQVSPTPPRYSDDGMLGLYFESEEVAQQFSSIIREDIASRINSGELRLGFDVPWLRSARYSVAAVEAVVGKVRDKYPSEVTDSQLLTAAEACARELGRTPTADELFRWIEEHREFPQG